MIWCPEFTKVLNTKGVKTGLFWYLMYCYEVTSGHHITKFYYINFFGHEVTNFNAPQKPTFLEKMLVWIFSCGAATEMWPQRLGKESPFFEIYFIFIFHRPRPTYKFNHSWDLFRSSSIYWLYLHTLGEWGEWNWELGSMYIQSRASTQKKYFLLSIHPYSPSSPNTLNYSPKNIGTHYSIVILLLHLKSNYYVYLCSSLSYTLWNSGSLCM